MIATALPTSPSAAGSAHAPASRPLELLEARQQRDALKVLLRKEQSAMADFLVALAEFDRCRGWEPLGHASLFAFLIVELGLSTSSTYWRKSAAELLQGFPELERYVRQGQLCLTTMAELAKVLTEENKEAVLPRFLGISSREAKEIVAELQPRETPPLRDVVRSVAPASLRPDLAVGFPSAASLAPIEPGDGVSRRGVRVNTYPELLRAPEMEMTHPARVAAKRDDVEPLSADLRRLHVTVSRQVLKKLEAARRGLGHAIPNATMEQALEAALDLLLEKQARARGQVKRPRTVVATATSAAGVAPSPVATSTRTAAPKAILSSVPTPGPDRASQGNLTSSLTSAPPPTPTPAPSTIEAATDPRPAGFTTPRHRREGPREHVCAAVRRAVWERDGGRCVWPLDSGGVCGSTHLLELDHIHPWAHDGEPTVANLRVVCHMHNTLAARREFGERCVERYRSPRRH